jgi:predicted phosphatase
MSAAKPFIAKNLVLAIDFDGTITTEPDMGKELRLQPHVKEVLTELKERGARMILWTCRSGAALNEALVFLQRNGMRHLFEEVNDQLHEIQEKYSPDVARKVGADYYIDDKNISTVIDWPLIWLSLLPILESLKGEN